MEQKNKNIHGFINDVCLFYDIDSSVLLSKKRGKTHIVSVRQCLQSVILDYFNINTVQCGIIFLRDHSSIVHSRELLKDYVLKATVKEPFYAKRYNEVLSIYKQKYEN
jgi:chromosomal replication initiation ATPase DnaA